MSEFDEIYATYFSPVYLYARRLTGNAHAAEELTAETFFRALKAINSFDGSGDIRVWLCQIAKNTWYSQLRRGRREAPMPEDFDAEDGAPPFSIALEDDEASQRLHELLHRMDEPYKEVFTLRIFGELPFQRIAALFGVYATIKTPQRGRKYESKNTPALEKTTEIC